MIEIIAFSLLMFAGLWMTESGLRSLLGAPDLPSGSLFHVWLKRVSPETAHAVGPVFAKLTAPFWAVLGVIAFLLAV